MGVVRARVAIVTFASTRCENSELMYDYSRSLRTEERNINYCNWRTTPIIEIAPFAKGPFGNPKNLRAARLQKGAVQLAQCGSRTVFRSGSGEPIQRKPGA